MTSYTIRKAVETDLPSLAAMLRISWKDTYTGLLPDDEIDRTIARIYSVDALRNAIQDSDWTGYYIAVKDGVVLGAGGGAFKSPDSSELYVIYVHPEMRYRGIGRRLLDAITAELIMQGAKDQWVSVTQDNAKGVPFYEARGFELKGTRGAWRKDKHTGEDVYDENRQTLRFWRQLVEGE